MSVRVELSGKNNPSKQNKILQEARIDDVFIWINPVEKCT
jgi:hypothetical protein